MYQYKIYRADKKIIALSTFAGKAVRGIAKCDPRDDYSAEYGETLAVARCASKISDKRVKSAKAKLTAATKALEAAQKQYDKMTQYYADSVRQADTAKAEVSKLLETTP